MIERHLFRQKAKASFVVVTNDRTVTDIAIGLGARAMKNSLFVELLKESDDTMKAILWNEKIKAHGFHRPLDPRGFRSSLESRGFRL